MRWISIVILWVCIVVNGFLIFHNWKQCKRWRAIIEEATKCLADTMASRNKYRERLAKEESDPS